MVAAFIPTVFTNRPLSGGSKDGEITHDDYRHMSDDYKQQAESIYTVLCTLREERSQLENGIDAQSPFFTPFLKYQNIDKLTRDILI